MESARIPYKFLSSILGSSLVILESYWAEKVSGVNCPESQMCRLKYVYIFSIFEEILSNIFLNSVLPFFIFFISFLTPSSSYQNFFTVGLWIKWSCLIYVLPIFAISVYYLANFIRICGRILTHGRSGRTLQICC